MQKNTTKAEYMNYQEYFNNFLGAWSFANGDEVLTIANVSEETMYDAQTGSQKTGLCIRFEEKTLPMVLNKTNAAMIAQVTGTSYMHDWIGKKIAVGTENVRAFGKVAQAIRVRDRVPEPETVAEPATEAQKKRIRELIDDGTINEQALCKYLRIGDINGISRAQAINAIKTKTGEVLE